MILPLAVSIWMTAALAAVSPVPAAHHPAAKPEVAIVSFLSGHAVREDPAGIRHPVRLWDRLPEGTWLEVGSLSRVGVAFASGRRFVLRENARVLLGKKSLEGRDHVRELPRVKLRSFGSVLTGTPVFLTEIAGTPIRRERIRGLYPRLGAATPAGRTILCFDAVVHAGRYQVEVFDEEGKSVFETATTEGRVSVPPTRLRAGDRYSWQVRTLDRPGPAAEGQAEFVTLSAKVARDWETLRRELGHDEEFLPLLALIEQNLGLFAEARTDLEEALRRSPEAAGLREALAQLTASMDEDDGT